MTRNMSERAREFLAPYFDMLDDNGWPNKMNREVHSAKLAASYAQIQAEARLEEARKWKPLECQQESHHPLRSPICRTCQKMAQWEERLAALAQALQPEEKEGN
jgi:hypothetical protein